MNPPLRSIKLSQNESMTLVRVLLFRKGSMRFRALALITLSAILSACVDTSLEMNSLEQASGGGGTGGKWGRVTAGAGTVVSTTSNYVVRSRASINPPGAIGTTANFRVKGSIKF